MTGVAVTLTLHMEMFDARPLWWAETPDLPGFYAAGWSLAELQSLALEALREELGTEVKIEFVTRTDS